MGVSRKLNAYPTNIKPKIEYLRALIFEVVRDDGIEDLSRGAWWHLSIWR